MANQAPDTGRKPENRPKQAFSPEQVRQGEIILRTRTRKIIFFGGLIAIVLFTLFMSLAR